MSTNKTYGLTDMSELLALQRAACLEQGAVSAEVRVDRLDRALRLVHGHQARIVAALDEDFIDCLAGTLLGLADTSCTPSKKD